MIFATLLLAAPLTAAAQSLLDGLRRPWSTYVFVSTQMPRDSLVSLAREASQAGAVLVLRGFPTEPADLGAMQRFVASIDAECCGVAGEAKASTRVAWEIDPRLFERFHVTAAPTFVVAANVSSPTGVDFSSVQGDMALANALKFMAQDSALPAVRSRAATLYLQTFGGRP